MMTEEGASHSVVSPLSLRKDGHPSNRQGRRKRA